MNVKLVLKFCGILLVIILAGLLRYRNFDKVPFPGESMDEYSYTWVGLSLLKTGVPVGISGIGGYKNEISQYINVDNVYQSTAGGNPETINWPWFDHPPLLGLITGGYAISKGASNFWETNIYTIRKPMLVMGVIAVLEIIIFGWLNFGYGTGILSGLIYGTMPVVVIGSRMVQGENGVIPAYLLAMILATLYIKTNNHKLLIGAGVMTGLGCLFKLSGVAVAVAITGWLWQMNKPIKIYLESTMAILFLFVVYGMAIGWQDFLAIFLANSNRFYGIGAESVYNLFTQVKITNVKFLTDPNVLVGWIIFCTRLSHKNKKIGERLLLIMTISWLIIYIFMGSYAHGWYAFPFYPLLAMLMGKYIYNAFKKSKSQFLIGILGILTIGETISRLISIEKFQILAPLWRWLVPISLLMFGVGKFYKNKEFKIAGKMLLVVIVAGWLVLNMMFLNLMTTDFWYKIF